MALTEQDRTLVELIAREVTNETAAKIFTRFEDVMERLTRQRDTRVAEMIDHHAVTCTTVTSVMASRAWSSGVRCVLYALSSMLGSGLTIGIFAVLKYWK